MKITRSLRWRIQLWHGSFLILLLVGLGFSAYHYEKQRGQKRMDDELSKRLAIAFDSLPRREEGRPPPRYGDPDDGHRPPPPEHRRRGGDRQGFRLPPQGESFFKDHYYVIWGRDGQVLGRSESFPPDVPVPSKPHAGEDTMRRTRGDIREAYLFTPPGDCVLVGTSMVSEREVLKRYAAGLFGIEAVILFIGLGGGWWMTSRSLRPLVAIRKAAVEISDGKLDRRIDLPADQSELGELAEMLNETFAKLEAAFARQTQFTSDAAHELRTPLSVVISQAQIALRGKREPEEYREMFEATLRGARRMQSLTQSLLELAGIDNTSNSPGRVTCDLSELAGDAIAAVRHLAAERGVEIRALVSSAPCMADHDSVTRVIINLLNNAIEHGSPNGEITVTSCVSENKAVLSVSDNGPGIAEHHLPHLFERFYRADGSRNRKTGGSGLGLAICKAVIDAHGGAISVSNRPEGGCVFTFSIPGK
jgi:two-component system OmpR family sensor kinase